MYARARARNSDTPINKYEHLIKQYEYLIKQYEHLIKQYEHLIIQYEYLIIQYEYLIKQFEYMKHPRDLRGCLCLMSNHYPESGDWFREAPPTLRA